jgi:peptidoglycan/LPS O-acetylase OafA/YrhL
MIIKELNQGGQMIDPTNNITAYRPDIDGLRAVAVLAVLVFHCFPTLLSGGFVGVDVFFVISGYLIGRSSFDEMAAGNYSASAYFGRRARRIFPALLVILIAVLLTAWWILLPVEFQLLGKHVAGASVFISNWQFWREVGYFNTEATLKPLLHLWSLAVEEQFYLLFPLVLIFSRRSATQPTTAIDRRCPDLFRECLVAFSRP